MRIIHSQQLYKVYKLVHLLLYDFKSWSLKLSFKIKSFHCIFGYRRSSKTLHETIPWWLVSVLLVCMSRCYTDQSKIPYFSAPPKLNLGQMSAFCLPALWKWIQKSVSWSVSRLLSLDIWCKCVDTDGILEARVVFRAGRLCTAHSTLKLWTHLFWYLSYGNNFYISLVYSVLKHFK